MAIFYKNQAEKKKRYKSRFFWGFLLVLCMIITGSLCCGIFSENEVLAEESLNMYSGSYALIDGDTGRVLTGKKETEPMPNASTTKILTCIVTLENCSIDEIVTISANAAAQPKVRFGMQEGEQYSLEELLYGLMLESYNDCAVAIAEHVAGSEEAFSVMMNEKAKEIGCTNTYFITPNGLDAEDENGFHHTTAEDLCKIMAYCTWESPMRDMFLQITQTRSYKSFVNRNAFLDQMDILSGKTGYTSKAGYCYVAALEENGEKYCIALLACGWPNNKNYKWQDAKILLNYGMENYSMQEVVIDEKKEKIQVDGYVNMPVFADLNQEKNLYAVAEGREYEVLLKDNEKLQEELILYKDTQLPIEEGQVLGECNIYLETMLLDKIMLTADSDSEEWGFDKILEVILCQFFTFSS